MSEPRQPIFYNKVTKEYRYGTRTTFFSSVRSTSVKPRKVKEDIVSRETFDWWDCEVIQQEFGQMADSDIRTAVCNPILPRDRADNVKRSKDKCREICLNNRFDYFITLTLDSKHIDRYSAKAASAEVQYFCKTAVRKNGLIYLIVPELHKDGAVHMHGLISFDETRPLELVDSGLCTSRGQHIYNIPSWTAGFTTAIPLVGDYAKVINYVLKYITKDTAPIFGKRYYSGGKLLRVPLITSYDIVDYESVDLKEYPVPYNGQKIKYQMEYTGCDLGNNPL